MYMYINLNCPWKISLQKGNGCVHLHLKVRYTPGIMVFSTDKGEAVKEIKKSLPLCITKKSSQAKLQNTFAYKLEKKNTRTYTCPRTW